MRPVPIDRWQARPVLAILLRVAILAVPLLTSVAATALVARLLPDGAARTWSGLAVLLVVAVVVAKVVERAARRLLPLAVLLRLTMLFPDRAPSRLRLARSAAGPVDTLAAQDDTPAAVSAAVLSLVARLGSHDRRTRGHSERVRLLCDMLAEELGLDADDRDRLRWSALLHDVGKLEVATAILNKPAALDAAEFDAVKRHPVVGARLVSPLLPWLGEWGRGIAEHHEKYDGTGYPAGTAGRDISDAGRLIAVVDAFETMTAARPYKKAMATRTARAELARCAGTHFDPGYVRAFLAISLPRVLWTMGPLSFALQLPFLRGLAEAGARTSLATGQAATGAAQAAAGAAAGVALAGAAAAGAGAPPVELPRAQDVGDVAPQVVVLPEASASPERVVRPTAVTRPDDVGGAGEPVTRGVPAAPARTTARPSPTQDRVAAPRSTGAPAAPRSASPSPTASDRAATTITSGPRKRTRARTATFTMTSPVGTTFQCRLQGQEEAGWTDCTSPVAYTGLEPGPQRFRVRSVDADGRKGPQETYLWEVLEPAQVASPAPRPGAWRGGPRTST